MLGWTDRTPEPAKHMRQIARIRGAFDARGEVAAQGMQKHPVRFFVQIKKSEQPGVVSIERGMDAAHGIIQGDAAQRGRLA